MREGPITLSAIATGAFGAWLLLSLLATARAKDVDYQPSPMPVVRAMLELAGVDANDVVYDLGSGDGRIVIMAAREFGARGVGIEIDPALVAEARANARAAGVEHKVRFVEGNIFDADIQPATVVTLFLHPEPNLRLKPNLLTQLKPGSRVVSYIWDMGDWAPEAKQPVGNRMIYLWRIPAQRAGYGASAARNTGISGLVLTAQNVAPPLTPTGAVTEKFISGNNGR